MQSRSCDGCRPGRRSKKALIEQAYRIAETAGIAVWCEDEAGPFGTVPYEGESWQPQEHPAQYPHEYIKDGTAKLLTLFHPKDGKVRVKGVQSCTNQVLHPWLKQELAEIVQSLPPSTAPMSADEIRLLWRYCSGCSVLKKDGVLSRGAVKIV